MHQDALEINAPAERALLTRPCNKCAGVVAFVCGRNDTVDRALRYLKIGERLQRRVEDLRQNVERLTQVRRTFKSRLGARALVTTHPSPTVPSCR